MALMENGERLKWLQSLAVFVFHGADATLFRARALSTTPKAFGPIRLNAEGVRARSS
jgi:hypothetical protein